MDIIPSEQVLKDIITLSNNSPRYLFRQLSYIYDQQSEIDNKSLSFSPDAINRGQLSYSQSFDYYALYPTKRKSKEDILTNINRLLKIGKETIKTKDFVEIFNMSTQTAISYIGIIKEYDLIKELSETESGAKLYEIKDPVLKHLIKHKITEVKK